MPRTKSQRPQNNVRARFSAPWIAPRLLLIGLWLTACGGVAAGDAERGRQIYHGEIALQREAPACFQCHPVAPSERAAVLGPNLSNIGNRAANTVPGQTAEAYLAAAILDPDSFLAEGFQEGIHYRDYRRDLSEQQVQDLIAYMLTLRSGDDR